MNSILAGGTNHEPFFGLEDLRQHVALIHLKQLRKSGAAASERPPNLLPDSCNPGLQILIGWNKDNKDVIDAAKAQREPTYMQCCSFVLTLIGVFGPLKKLAIDWKNPFLAFMESCAMYLRCGWHTASKTGRLQS